MASKVENIINFAKDKGVLGIVKAFYEPILFGKNNNSYNPFFNNNIDYVKETNSSQNLSDRGYPSSKEENNGVITNAGSLQKNEGKLSSDLANSGAVTAGSGYDDPIFDYNAREAQKERDWSEYMSNTSHQREVADLKAAGLNPILSANGGAAGYTGASADANTSMDIARLQAATALKQTQISSGATVTAALLANDANKYMADRHNLGSLVYSLINRA